MGAVAHAAKMMAKVSKIMNIPLFITEQNPLALGATIDELKKINENNPLAKTFAKTRFSMVEKKVLK